MKIFGIGLHKTGTTSLSSALQILGYNTIRFPYKFLKSSNGELSLDYNKINKYDALCDTPIAYFYKELDKKFPNSKFILTIRDLEKWAKSAKKHFSITRAILRENFRGKEVKDYIIRLFGTDVFDYEKFVETYKNHNKQVQDYFSNRKEDILLINICNGGGWDKLCSFLKKPIPEEKFPVKNRGLNIKNFLCSDYLFNPIYKILNYSRE